MTRTAKVFTAGALVSLLGAAVFIVVKSQGAPRASSAQVTMMSDLKNLALYQGYRKDSIGRYASSPDSLDYRVSDGVTRPVIALTPDGYTVTVGHRDTPIQCVIYAGSTAIAPATRPETPRCTEREPTKGQR